ncbi:MAG TPA: FKBP-type peptidyl-prolyl cis-trans isomerase [Methanocella sp.]|nr:FKBP-type peptidyl-prolyl cis-trans isomerase [Methanocella sp.]
MLGKWKVLLAALILSALVLGCTAEKTVRPGNTVTIDYTGKYVNGTVFETTNTTVAKENNIYSDSKQYAPFSFVVGSGGALIKAFDDQVRGMKVNETKNITVTPGDGFGEYDASNVATVPLGTLKANNTNMSLYVGQPIYYNDEYIYVVSAGPDNRTARIIKLNRTPYSVMVNADNSTATLDFNNPLAGKSLYYEITVLEIK